LPGRNSSNSVPAALNSAKMTNAAAALPVRPVTALNKVGPANAPKNVKPMTPALASGTIAGPT